METRTGACSTLLNSTPLEFVDCSAGARRIAEVDMPLGVSEADGRGAGPHFDGFTYQGQ